MTEHLLARIDALADHHLPPILQCPEKPSPKISPDSDALKMFVGYIPRTWDEQKLTYFFEAFGPVFEINVLQHKETNLSKNCCFITFFSRKSALAAQNALHNTLKLPGMRNAIQMKIATENRKVFVKMLPKSYSEMDVLNMFSFFGNIEECRIIKDLNGQSRGQAFITFGSRQHAKNAINSMNQVQYMKGCPLVVKFADMRKERYMKDQQQMDLNVFKSVNPSVNPNFEQPYRTGITEYVGLQLINELHLPVSNLSTSQTPSFPLSSRENVAIPSTSTSLQYLTTLANLVKTPGLNTMALQNPAVVAAATTRPSGANPSSMKSVTLPMTSSVISNSSGIAASSTNFQLLTQLANLSSSEYFSSFLQPSPAFARKQVKGPEGANLYIYNVPPEYTDTDLAQMFMPFGKVVSAKVFIDKITQLSKCYGFVSYDDPAVAVTAIHAMNGIRVGTRKLKVQLKKSEKSTKPY